MISHRMTNCWKLFFLTLFCFVGLNSSFLVAQSDSTTVKKEEKAPIKLFPDGIRLGTDLYTWTFTALEPDFFGYEINADISLNNHYFLTLDYGSQKAERENDKSDYLYMNEGSFVRFGIEKNLMGRKFPNDAIIVGLKYGIANFDHQITYTSLSDDYGDLGKTVVIEGLQAQWLELNTGLKIKIVGNLYLAGLLKVKFLTADDDSESLAIAEIPGFGIRKSRVRGGIGYQILYKIPFSKKTPKR